MFTAYASFARLLDGAGVECLLIGDSLGNVIRGHDTDRRSLRGRHRLHTPLPSNAAPTAPSSSPTCPSAAIRIAGTGLPQRRHADGRRCADGQAGRRLRHGENRRIPGHRGIPSAATSA